jgi:rubredoxin
LADISDIDPTPPVRADHRRQQAHPAKWPKDLPLLAVKYMCESCGFIYDPEEGDPDGGIPPGTAFEDIPETWFCPVCGARKRDFTPYED